MDGLQQVVELARSKRFPTNPEPGAPINVAWVHLPDDTRIEVWRGNIGKDDYKVCAVGRFGGDLGPHKRMPLADVLAIIKQA